MKRQHIIIFFFAIMALMASCSENMSNEAAPSVQGTEARVAVTISAAPLQAGTPESRATIDESMMDEATVATATVSDLWLIEYDEGGTQIGQPRYMTWQEFSALSALPVILPTDDKMEYTCVVVANTHDANALSTATMTTLETLAKRIHTLYDLYNYMPADEMEEAEKCDLVMNGFFKVTSQTTSASCTLYRNVAKLRLTLKNETGSGIKLRTIRLRDVPNSMCYADQAVMDGLSDEDFTANPFPALSDTTFIDFETDLLGTEGKGVAQGEETTLTYYLPRNMRGKTATTDAKNRNTDSPYKATYIELLATKVDALGNELTPIRYRFYVGGDNTGDFNVKANHLYEMPITFTQAGNAETDSRVEDMGCTLLAADANSHIITPIDLDVQQVYELPIDRVNEFWDGTVYAKQLPDYNGVIDESTEWEASVLWQDQKQQMILFCDETGKVTVSSPGLYSSKGLSKNIFFKTVKGACGNVLLGIKKKGEDTYLWSWHLWISDYNPDEVLGKRNDYETDVAGGRILRYDDAKSQTWWSKLHANAVIMDRHLGATSANGDAKDVEPTRGLYYQWKRKDPKPYPALQLYTMGKTGTVEPMAAKEYSVNGLTSTSYLPIKAGKAYIAEAVQNPTTFYAPGGDVTGEYDWIKDEPKEDQNKWIALMSPAPKGWSIPAKGFFSLFTEEFMKGILTFRRGYQFYVDKAHTIKTWYPQSSNISSPYGHWYNNSSAAYVWTTQAAGTGRVYAYRYKNDDVNEYLGARGAGLSLRLVKE